MLFKDSTGVVKYADINLYFELFFLRKNDPECRG